MVDKLTDILTSIADFVCGYPLFIVLIGGGIFLMAYSGAVPLRRMGAALRELRRSKSGDNDQISSAQALASVVAATIGMGNIAGVAIALVMGGPGAIFWMWVSALVGMSTKYHEGVLAIKYRHFDRQGRPFGGPMWIIRKALPRRFRHLATGFAVAGMMGTLCIMNANQLAEASVSAMASAWAFDSDSIWLRGVIGLVMASLVWIVVIGGVKRLANVASVMVPFMVGTYFFMVAYIIATHIDNVPEVFASIFREAFSLRAGWGALIGVAIIGARRAALVNDAGVGTASIMHSTSANREPVREGLVAMLGPAIDSGFVCTLTALAILLCGDISSPDLKGLDIAMNAFAGAIPGGNYLLLAVVTCFAMSSMFSYSFYGSRCARYALGERKSRWYTRFWIASLVIFAMVPLKAAVGLCDLFYALMAFPTMFTLIMLRRQVKEETDRYFAPQPKIAITATQ
ncbi:MAG: alanine:cation symporter family protein [Paramuribaculum sp.]|nr:alanine:cation symporter family protein [Paramuribaculum sp.]